MSQKRVKLILFFSRGTSLNIWLKSGLLEREIESYKRFMNHSFDISFITYGKNENAELIKKIDPIEILYNRWKLPVDMFSMLSPIIFWKQLKEASFYKTNQINGWWSAGLAKLIFKKPLIVRCGYLLSTNQEQEWKKYSQLRIKLVSQLEKLAFKYADKIIVTTPQMKFEAINRHNITPEKIKIIPNTVNIDVFKPKSEIEKIEGRICFVGRFTSQKNLHLLIEAISGVKNTSIILIGDGPLKSELEEKAINLNVKVDFIGNVPNYKLPEMLNACQLFVLTSVWEGMPKALLEAMACGLPVIGTDAPGIRDVIKNGETGLLCKHDANEISNAIRLILNDKSLAQNLGVNARQYIVENFSLEKAVEKELVLLKSLQQKCQ